MNELLDKVASQGGGGASTAAAIRAGMSAHVDRNIAPKKRKVDQTADGASGAGGGTTRIRSVKDTVRNFHHITTQRMATPGAFVVRCTDSRVAPWHLIGRPITKSIRTGRFDGNTCIDE